MKRIIIGIVAAVLAISGGIAAATPSRGFVVRPLGSTTSDTPAIHPAGESVALFVRVTIAHDGTTGWHSHPSNVFVLVRQGRVQLFDGVTCTRISINDGDVS